MLRTRRDTRMAQVVQLRRLLDRLREECADLAVCARVSREIDRLLKSSDKEG